MDGNNSLNDKINIIGKIFSILILTDFTIGVLIFSQTIYTWGGITKMYLGLNAFSFISRIAIFFILGIVTVILLWKKLHLSLYAVVPYSLFVLFITRIWKIQPNGPAFLQAINQIQNTVEKSTSVTDEAIKIRIYTHPNVVTWFILIMVSIFSIFYTIKYYSSFNNKKL